MAEKVGSPLRSAAYTDTPLWPLLVRHRGGAHPLWLKLESHNPTGSIKYRTAVGLVAALDAERPLTAGTRVVESTSGNLGLALARVLTPLGCQLIAVIDPKVPAPMQRRLRDEGVSLVPVRQRDRHGGYLLTRLARVDQLRAADPALRWPDQYTNPANPAIHRDSTAGELLRQTGGELDALLIAVSTGGTLAGISEGVRADRPAVRIVAVDVDGSVVTRDVGGPHLLSGVGASRKSSFLRPGHYDRAVQVRDVEAFAYCRMLADDTGLSVGGSGGAVLAAFARALDEPAGVPRRPVAIMPDGGQHYRGTIYDDAWLAQHGVLGEVRAVQEAARSAGLTFSGDRRPAGRTVAG
jgi:cysteine synthase A